MKNAWWKSPLLGALLFAALMGWVGWKRAVKLDSPDFKVFYTAARHALNSPEKIYSDSPDLYLYPPSTALLLTPFAFTDNFRLHQISWHFLLVGVIFWLAKSGWFAFLAVALLTRYLQITLGYGQINLLLIGLLALVGRWIFTSSSAASAIFTLAVSLKIYPLVLAPAFGPGLSWKWRPILVGFLTGIFLLLLPFIFYGFDRSVFLYEEFFRTLSLKGFPTHSHNQSFHALATRLFQDKIFYLHAVGPVNWSIVDLPPLLIRAISLLIGIPLAILSWRKALKEKQGASYLAATSFCILFLSHIVWKDYFLFLYFPLVQIFLTQEKRRSLLLAALFLSFITLSSHDLVGGEISTRLDGACIHLWAAILIWWGWMRR